MNPLAIALQGVGFGALLVAVQGFAAVEVVEPVLPIESTASGGVSGIAAKPKAVEVKRYEVLKYEQPQDSESENQAAILKRLQSEGYGKQESDTAKTNAAIAKILAAVPEFIENQDVKALQTGAENQAVQTSTGFIANPIEQAVQVSIQQDLSDDEAYMLMALALEVMA